MKKVFVIFLMFIPIVSFAGPDRIISLAATNIMGNSLGFSWVVPAGAITNDVRLSTNAINTMNWSLNERLDYLDAAGTPGTVQLVTVVDLATNTTYFVAIKTQGTNGWSTMSNMARATTGGDRAWVTLAWNPPMTNYDGTIATTLAGFNIYYGTASQIYNIGTNNVGFCTTTTISNLIYGVTYYFAATDYDATGAESDYSNEVVYTPGQ